MQPQEKNETMRTEMRLTSKTVYNVLTLIQRTDLEQYSRESTATCDGKDQSVQMAW